MKRSKVIWIMAAVFTVVGIAWFLENVHYIILNRIVQKDWKLLFDGYDGNDAMVSTYESPLANQHYRTDTVIYCKSEQEFYYTAWNETLRADDLEGIVNHYAREKSRPTSDFRIFRVVEGRKPEPNEKWTGKITIYLPQHNSHVDYFLGQRAFRVVVLDGKVVGTRGWRTDW